MQLFELVEIQNNEENLPKENGFYIVLGKDNLPKRLQYQKRNPALTDFWFYNVHSYYRPVTEITHKDGASEGHSWVTQIKTLEEIIQLKENERKQWADTCIKKQLQIDELENEISALKNKK